MTARPKSFDRVHGISKRITVVQERGTSGSSNSAISSVVGRSKVSDQRCKSSRVIGGVLHHSLLCSTKQLLNWSIEEVQFHRRPELASAFAQQVTFRASPRSPLDDDTDSQFEQ